jgi:hypothetical protein
MYNRYDEGDHVHTMHHHQRPHLYHQSSSSSTSPLSLIIIDLTTIIHHHRPHHYHTVHNLSCTVSHQQSHSITHIHSLALYFTFIIYQWIEWDVCQPRRVTFGSIFSMRVRCMRCLVKMSNRRYFVKMSNIL